MLGLVWFQLWFARYCCSFSNIIHDENVPDSLNMFDQVIDERTQISSHGLISQTDNGVQTGTTLLNRLKMLKGELEERGVPFPVVILSDNQLSRKVEFVTCWLLENQITICTEPANSSGFLQAPDQYNRKWHGAYKRGVKQLRLDQPKPKKANMKKDLSINLHWFLHIVSLYWCSWRTPLDRLTVSTGCCVGG